MQKLVGILFLTSTLISCSANRIRGEVASRVPANTVSNSQTEVPPIQDPELHSELERFKTLAEEALVWRVLSIEFYKQVKDALEDDGHINHSELLNLHQSSERYLGLRERIMEVVKKREWLASPLAEVTYEPGKGTKFSERTAHPVRRGFLPTRVPVVTLDPTDSEGAKAITELKISLGAAMLLLDNYVYGIYPYFQNKHIRYLLNRDYPATRGKLKQITDEFVKPSNRKKVARAVALVFRDLQWREQNGMLPQTNEDFFLELLISQSPTFKHIVTAKKFGGPNSIEYIDSIIKDELKLTRRASNFYLSRFFGNTVGMIQFRKGKMKKLPELEKQQIAATMKPLDILLEKTPFRLTDRFIPGHWGHVAIWVGNEEELREIGVWDDPAVVPHQEAIRSGHRIVEALRPGVQLNSLEHFLDIDDLLLLRHTTLTPDEKREYLIRTFRQIGKEYDFNFDVETDRKIVCSELAYVVFHNIEWPTQKALGRYTISPDHVAIKALPGGPLVPVMIYHDGRLMPDDHQGSLYLILKLLLEQKYKELNKYLGGTQATPRDAEVFYKTIMESMTTAPPLLPAEQVSRDPASDGLKLLDGLDVQLFKDLFQFDTHGKQLRYTVRSKLWTNMEKEYLKENVQQALNEAIARTLSSEEPGGMLGKFKKNLTEQFIKEFVLSLQVYKIFNGTVQFDLYFLPEADSPDDFSNEYSSNRLIRLSETGTLSQKLKQEEEWTVSGQLGSVSSRLIELSRARGTRQPVIYAGGVVTLYLKLLDMKWDPFKPIPNPKKNAVKGFVRYRRYFIHDGSIAAASCKTERVSVDRLEWGPGTRQVDQMLTVDYYKSFNLAGFAPKPESLEIFPGRWLAANQGRAGLLPAGFLGLRTHEWVGRNLKTGTVYLSGKASVQGAPSAFEHRLLSVAFDFGKKRFDAAVSRVNGDVTPDAPNAVGDTMFALFENCPDYLGKALNLERVMTPIRGASASEEGSDE